MTPTNDRDFDERMVSLCVDEHDAEFRTEVYMRLGTLRDKAKGCTMCELCFVGPGTTMSFVAPRSSLKQLAKFILETVKDYDRLDERIGDL